MKVAKKLFVADLIMLLRGNDSTAKTYHEMKSSFRDNQLNVEF